MLRTNELINLFLEKQKLLAKHLWINENGWEFKVCTKNHNPFNERLDSWRIAHKISELEQIILKRKNKIINFYKNNYRKQTNPIWL